MAGIYLHIPFCKTRCAYCDFYSTTSIPLRRRYVQALCTELRERRDYLGGKEVKTIYLGGGTPSQLDGGELEMLFATLDEVYGTRQCEEITLEANPDDLTEEYVEMLRRLPVNRISMGVQTFDDAMLRLLNRRHTACQAAEAVERCRRAGFDNLSIDLIYGLPGETDERWRSDLSQAVALGVEHLSAYGLILEEGTPLERMVRAGERTLPDPDETDDMYQQGVELLSAAGYERYEISNFAKPGFACRHNLGYWQGKAYLGLGAAAHSHWPGPQGPVRRENAPDVDAYIRALRSGAAAPGAETVIGPEEAMFETLMLGLRTAQGVSERDFEARHGVALRRRYGEALEGLARDGLGRFEGPMQEGRFALTERGLALQNLVLLRLMDY